MMTSKWITLVARTIAMWILHEVCESFLTNQCDCRSSQTPSHMLSILRPCMSSIYAVTVSMNFTRRTLVGPIWQLDFQYLHLSPTCILMKYWESGSRINYLSWSINNLSNHGHVFMYWPYTLITTNYYLCRFGSYLCLFKHNLKV